MVEAINSWAQKIIIVIIICTIIEMILPEGKNKKYIKTVIGIYVVFTIISPIITNLNNDQIDLNKYLKIDNNISIETSTVIDTNSYIEEVYKEKLKTDIKSKIEEMGYCANKIDLKIVTENEEKYGEILEINLKLSKQEKQESTSNIQIEKIVIGEEKQEEIVLSEKEENEIKQYLAETYGVSMGTVLVDTK